MRITNQFGISISISALIRCVDKSTKTARATGQPEPAFGLDTKITTPVILDVRAPTTQNDRASRRRRGQTGASDCWVNSVNWGDIRIGIGSDWGRPACAE